MDLSKTGRSKARDVLVLFVALATLAAPFAAAPTAFAACGTTRGEWSTVQGPRFPQGGPAISAFTIDTGAPSRMYATNGTVVMTSSDEGCSWKKSFQLQAQPSLDQPYTAQNARIETIVARSGRAVLMIEESTGGQRPHILISSNSGSSWQNGDSGLPPAGDPEAIEIVAANPQVLYLAISVGGGSLDLLFASTNGGTSWQLRSDLANAAGRSTSHLEVDPARANEVWVSGATGLFHSTDGGRTFRSVPEAQGLAIGPIDVFHAGGPARIMAMAPQFGLISIDGGRHWFRVTRPGNVSSLAHGTTAESILASAGGKVFVYAPTVFSWVDAKAPTTGTGGLIAPTISNPSFYGHTARTIEIYWGPAGADIRTPDKEPPPADISLLPPGTLPEEEPAVLTPKRDRLKIPAGKTKQVSYRLDLPVSRTPLDIFFLIDTSDSATRFLARLREGLAAIVNELSQSGIDAEFGVAKYRTYPDTPGDVPRPDETTYVYERILDIGPVSPALAQAIESIDADSGGHYNAALEALYQAATGAGEDVDPPGPLGKDVPPGQQGTFRAKALKLLVHSSDDVWEITPRINDPSPPDMPSFDAAMASLNERNIQHVGLALGPNGVADLTRAAQATGTTSPAGGVDCNGDGAADIGAGAPLVCALTSRDLDTGGSIVPAIVNLVEAVRTQSAVSLDVQGREAFIKNVTPETYPSVTLQRSNVLDFDVTYKCPVSLAGTRTTIDLKARDGSRVLDSASLVVLCGGVPNKKKDKESPLFDPPFEALIGLVPIPLIGPPGPIPEFSSASQAQSQAQAQANAAVAQQEQEQPQVAFAHAYKAAVRTAVEEELQMTAYRERRDVLPPASFMGAAALMAAAFAYMSLRPSQRLRTRSARRSR